MARRKGHTYVADIQIILTDLQQAENFAMQGTVIGDQVKLDLEDDAIVETLVGGEDMVVSVNYPDGLDEDAEKELKAAAHVGAELLLELIWEKNE